MIKIIVDVDNAQPATELLPFYSHSIELVQHFLLQNKLLTESRSTHLQSVFAEMEFLAVESIRLSYRYGTTVRKALSSSIVDGYIDELTRKFYILQKYEKNESRHIDILVNYLLPDESVRLKASQVIRNLFKIYQDEGIPALIKLRENLPEQQVSKWIIPQMIKKQSTDSSSEDNEQEDETNDEPVVIPPEMLEKMKNEPGWELPKPKSNVIIDPNQPKMLTCFPPRAGSTDLVNPPEVRGTPSVSEEPRPSTENNANPPISTPASAIPKTNNDTTPKNDKAIDGHAEKKTIESNTGGEKVSERSITPLKIADFTTAQPRISFEHIRISNFSDIALSPSALPNPPTTIKPSSSDNETDVGIGRRGEEFVYRYLQWKYPNAQVRWINEQQETGYPYDIQMVRKETGNQVELIEVKTTRILKQNTFQISVGEVECLLANQDNYYIYRVYSSNDEKSSTITILSQIKCHLQQKHLALAITVADKFDQE